jgi:hypothetical protein
VHALVEGREPIGAPVELRRAGAWFKAGEEAQGPSDRETIKSPARAASRHRKNMKGDRITR